MDHPILNSLLQPALLIFLIAFTVLMALMIPAYFYAYRPKNNSTEWIGRLDRRSFRPLTLGALSTADIVWALICLACAVFLWYAHYVLWWNVKWHVITSGNLFHLIVKHLYRTIPVAVTALSLYLLMRLMHGKPLPAILAAVIGALSLTSQATALALFSLSLLFLYLWVCAPYDAPTFFNAVWLALSAGAYGLSLLSHFPLIWALPFYFGIYIVMQVVRWKNGNPQTRRKKLVLSIVLLLLLILLGVIAVWLVYCVKRHKGSPIDLLRSFSFYKSMIPGLLSRLSTLTRRASYWYSLVFSDSLCFLAGVIAMIPLLHRLIKLRDTRCLFLLLLLPCLLLAWYFSACYAMVPVFALVIGMCWSSYADRGRPLYAVGFAATYVLFLFAELFIH
ncbi:MAG: hypothetical protein IJJ99_03180 [Oscillospiraceae bacterium]|nr:hypothetical protein [Oscillospiraceae bacterium]